MRHIDTQTLKQRLDKGDEFVLVNALSPEAFSEGHIPGSDNLPATQEDLAEKAGHLAGSKDEEIIVYCASPECDASTKAAHKLEDAGFTNVVEYDGGMKEWKESGYEVEKSSSGEKAKYSGCC
jgi:rhodanese-related sulfurtransferase